MRDPLVLCYHAVSESWPAPLSVTPERFEQQVKALARRGYRGVTFHEAATVSNSGRRVAVTFDDAYRSVLELARPILKRHGMPATVFVPTAFPDRDEPMAWPGIGQWLQTEHRHELTPMSWNQLDELAADGWEVGSHTRSHPHLTSLGDAALQAELQRSRHDCEQALGRPCRSLAYPYGDHDDRVVRAARTAGYAAAATLPGRVPAQWTEHDHPRIGVYHRDDRRRFALKVSPVVRRLRASPAWALLRPRPTSGG